MKKRIVTTCFGLFRIEGHMAISVVDSCRYYHLPYNMTNEEIKSYFELLKENEE